MKLRAPANGSTECSGALGTGYVQAANAPERSALPIRVVLLACLLMASLAACGVDRPPEDASGPEIYRMVCANCHSEDLSGGIGPPLGPGSASVDLPDTFLEVTITRGRGRMPSFSRTLSDDQLDRLITYIREVQAG